MENKALYITGAAILVAIIIVALTYNSTDYYNDDTVVNGKKYIGHSEAECSTIRFICEEGEYFADNEGCGCIITEAPDAEQPPSERLECEAYRGAEVCTEEYHAVCGWFDPEKIKCLKYPCAQTFSNTCFACSNENVLYYTEGECPTG